MSEHNETSAIRLTADASGNQTVVVEGVLDASVVAAVCATVENAPAANGSFTLDLRAVSAVEGDSVGALARALRELGVEIDRSARPDQAGDTDRA